ncbi:hypothetical protein JST97_07610 [bacterium]|nr:hypothetical protein [bacterium]
MTRAARFGFRLSLLLFSSVLALVAAELVLRIVRPKVSYAYVPQPIYISHFRPSAVLPFELKPNNRSRFAMLEFDTTVVTNSLGLRSPELDRSRPRLLVLGDSFTFGFGVENDQSFCAVAGRGLEPQLSVVNAGFADGFSPDCYALWLRLHKAEIEPRAILACFFQNDYSDVNSLQWMREGRVQEPDDPLPPDRIQSPGNIVTEDGAWLPDSRISRLPAWVRRGIKSSYCLALIRDRWLQDVKPTNWEPVADSAAQSDAKFLKALEHLRQAAGTTPLIFYLISRKGSDGPSRMDQLVTAFAKEHKIRLLSNRQDFTQADFFPRDTHWTAEGHAKAGRFLAEQLSGLKNSDQGPLIKNP